MPFYCPCCGEHIEFEFDHSSQNFRVKPRKTSQQLEDELAEAKRFEARRAALETK